MMSDDTEKTTRTDGKVVDLATYRTRAKQNQQEGRSLSAIFQRVGQLIDDFNIELYIAEGTVARETSLLDLSDKIVDELSLNKEETRDEFKILVHNNVSCGFNDYSFPHGVEQQPKFIRKKREAVKSMLCTALHNKMGGG